MRGARSVTGPPGTVRPTDHRPRPAVTVAPGRWSRARGGGAEGRAATGIGTIDRVRRPSARVARSAQTGAVATRQVREASGRVRAHVPDPGPPGPSPRGLVAIYR